MRHILLPLLFSGGLLAAPAQEPRSERYRFPVRNVAGLYSANFGEMRPNHFHSGVDIKPDGVTGKPVVAAAAGYVVHFFPTGQGNIIGNPIVPVIKLSANPRTIRTMSEHMDVDVSGILRREMNLDQAGDKLLDMMFQTIAGRMTAAEALKQNQFVMTRLYESA